MPPDKRTFFKDIHDDVTRSSLEHAFTYPCADEDWTRVKAALLAATENPIS